MANYFEPFDNLTNWPVHVLSGTDTGQFAISSTQSYESGNSLRNIRTGASDFYRIREDTDNGGEIDRTYVADFRFYVPSFADIYNASGFAGLIHSCNWNDVDYVGVNMELWVNTPTISTGSLSGTRLDNQVISEATWYHIVVTASCDGAPGDLIYTYELNGVPIAPNGTATTWPWIGLALVDEAAEAAQGTVYIDALDYSTSLGAPPPTDDAATVTGDGVATAEEERIIDDDDEVTGDGVVTGLSAGPHYDAGTIIGIGVVSGVDTLNGGEVGTVVGVGSMSSTHTLETTDAFTVVGLGTLLGNEFSEGGNEIHTIGAAHAFEVSPNPWTGVPYVGAMIEHFQDYMSGLNAGDIPVVPASPTPQDIVTALMQLGLISQAP